MAWSKEMTSMKIEGRHEREVTLSDYEALLLAAVKALFASKSDYGDGADFRQAFVSELMDGYCDACGSGWPGPCYCTRDD